MEDIDRLNNLFVFDKKCEICKRQIRNREKHIRSKCHAERMAIKQRNIRTSYVHMDILNRVLNGEKL
jgi:Na+/phosphate symporter